MTKPRKPLLVNLTWATAALLSLAVLYVLSYAPAFRLKYGNSVPTSMPMVTHLVSLSPPEDVLITAIPPPSEFIPTVTLPDPRWQWLPLSCYRPVEWLIDQTPLREPLFQWAGLFGVEDSFRNAAEQRAA
jgi:hypothetical protein